MKYVYYLAHRRYLCKDEAGDEIYSTNFIGYFSSKKIAKNTIKKYKTIQGFKDYPNSFELVKMKIDFYDWKESAFRIYAEDL